MPSKVVTPKDIVEKYGEPHRDFKPNLRLTITAGKAKRTDLVRTRFEGTLEYGYLPGQEIPSYARTKKGPWQCLDSYGRVVEEKVSWRPLHLAEEEGYVYFIQQGESGPYKIGWSKDVERRLGELQVANPFPLHIRAVLEGTRMLESETHARFKSASMAGEWFENTDEIRAFLAQLSVK